MSKKVISIKVGPTVNVDGKDYPTELVDGIQRFKENKALWWFVERASFANPDHPDPIERGRLNPNSRANLNTLKIAYLEGKFSQRDYMEFLMMTGYSVCGFADAVPEAKISNPLWKEKK